MHIFACLKDRVVCVARVHARATFIRLGLANSQIHAATTKHVCIYAITQTCKHANMHAQIFALPLCKACASMNASMRLHTRTHTQTPESVL